MRLPRRALRTGALVAAAMLAAGVGWTLLAPRVARHHSIAVRRECEESSAALAWFYRAPKTRQEANWVAREILAARPSMDDASVDELEAWVARELASPSPALASPPGDVARQLAAHDAELAEVRALLLGSDPITWPAGAGADLRSCRDLLLASALARAGARDDATASADLLAAWRLARSLATVKLGADTARDVVGALRKLARVPPRWTERLDASAWRKARADRFAESAAYSFTSAQNVHAAWLALGARPPTPARLVEPLQSWQWTTDGRLEARLGETLRDPASAGLPLRHAESSLDAALGLDSLDAQIELTQKVAELQRLRDAEGRWPERLDGIERSRLIGLAWRYEGGAHCVLTPEGINADRLRPNECEPALSFRSD